MSAVVLMGVSGSGKSTTGLALADRCGGVFLDADDFHPVSNIEKMKRGEPLDDGIVPRLGARHEVDSQSGGKTCQQQQDANAVVDPVITE